MVDDTPTHRVHILQANTQQIVEWTQLLQTQRNAIVEKLVRVKANNKAARAITVDRQLSRTFARLQRDLSKVEELLNKSADNLNKCRGLLLEATDGELLLERTEPVHGNHAKSETDRGVVSQGTDRPEDHRDTSTVSREATSTAPANNDAG